MNEKEKLKIQIKQKELQLKKLHLSQNKNEVCEALINTLVLEKAILKKKLDNLNSNKIIEQIKRVTHMREKRICDYFKA